jgi:hypothetical protein
MDALVDRLALAIERAHHGRAGLIRAPDERGKPTGADDHVVVDEDHVLRFDPGEAQVAGLVGREVVLGPQQLEALLGLLLLEMAADSGWRSAVDVHEAERNVRVLVDARQRSGCKTETFARDHDDGHLWLCHGRLPVRGG